MTSSLQKTVEIRNSRGLHARAAAKFVRLVEEMGAQVTVSKDGLSVTGASIMGLLTLSASINTKICIAASGPRAAETLNALTCLVERRFDEE